MSNFRARGGKAGEVYKTYKSVKKQIFSRRNCGKVKLYLSVLWKIGTLGQYQIAHYTSEVIHSVL